MLIAAGYIVNKTRSTPKINEPRLGDDVLGGWGGGHVCQWGRGDGRFILRKSRVALQVPLTIALSSLTCPLS